MLHIQIKKHSLRLKLGLIFISTSIFFSTEIFALNEQPKAVWYRYYDQNGVANLSTSVTPSHIRYGYEALDNNMQVIKKNRAYNVDQDLKQSSSRASQAIQQEQDARLKRAYTNSRVAINKKNEQLQNIKKQIALQQTQLKQIQNDRVLFKRQETALVKKGKAIPNELKDRLNYNAANINNTQQTIQSLQANYINTQKYYDSIISRLKKLE